MGRLTRLAVFIGALIVGVVGGVVIFISHDNHGTRQNQLTVESQAGRQGPPQEWKTTLRQAEQRATFRANIPNHSLANRGNVMAVFLDPQGRLLTMDFPAPAPPTIPVRQDFIEVFESPWAGGDPSQVYAEDLVNDPAEGKRIVEIDGHVALVVEAHSATDESQANAAFLRLVINDIEIQISGGESVDRLEDIAKTMI
jgi:hypothetical protein